MCSDVPSPDKHDVAISEGRASAEDTSEGCDMIILLAVMRIMPADGCRDSCMCRITAKFLRQSLSRALIQHNVTLQAHSRSNVLMELLKQSGSRSVFCQTHR